MKKYIIALIGFILVLISINTVYAATSPYWGSGSDIIHPLVAAASDCGNGKCVTDLNASFHSVNNNNGIYYFDSTTSTSMSSNGAGVLWTYQPNTTLKSNYLYSLTTYICHSSSANIVYKGLYANTSVSNVQNLNSSTTVYATTLLTNLNQTPFNGVSFTKCGFVNNIFKSNNNSKYVGLNYTLDSNSSNYYTYLIGYSIDSLGDANGLTSSDIQNVINGSGLASANDIDSLQDSVDDIQSSLNSIENNINNNIDNAESNIIDSQEQTRDAIIQNQNENTDKEIESQKVCQQTELGNNVLNERGYLDVNGNTIENDYYMYTSEYIKLESNEIYQLIMNYQSNAPSYCIYDTNKILENCYQYAYRLTINITNTSEKYIRYSGSINGNNTTKLIGKICKNGNQALSDNINNVNDSLNNSDISGANSDAGGFFSGFTSNDFGLSSIITMPLQFISHLTDNNTCDSLVLPLPFVNQNATLPCMTSIYNTYFHDFLVLYQTITTGIISYWVCINIFRMVQGFKNPESDQIEVMDL